MLNFNRCHLCTHCLTLLLAAAMPPALSSASQVFDASADFDISNNPSTINGGTYRYGSTPSLGGTFTLLPGTFTSGSVAGYNAGPAGSDPAISKNLSNSPFDLHPPLSTIHYEPQQLVLHPGGVGEYAVLRFTAPLSGTYSYSAAFNSADSAGASTDVHILINNINAATAGINVDGGGGTATLSSPSLSLVAGDTIDFIVGRGNASNLFDSTGLFATVTLVPEPSTLAMLIAGATVLAAGALRRRCRP